MTKPLLITLATGLTALLSACGSPPDKPAHNTAPPLNIRDYFTGRIEAWGILQDWRGTVTRQFDITLVGSWTGDKGTLEEDFFYYDGHTQKRTWYITALEDGTYEGRADDVIGAATSTSFGNATQWQYTMELPVHGRTLRFQFDDWMWGMNDGVLINRSAIKKFGITVAELTIFMKKVTPLAALEQQKDTP